MPDEPAYIRNLRSLSRAEPEFIHLEALEREIYASGSDRAAAIMWGSFLEVNLERLLLSRMRDGLNSKDRRQLFEYEGALGTFASKIIVTYALKLIGPLVRSDLDLIRFLRNEFAHSRMPFDFMTSEVRAVCDQLKAADWPGSFIPHGYHGRVPYEKLADAIDIKHPRTRFVTTCHALAYRLIVATHGPREGDQVFPNDDPVP